MDAPETNGTEQTAPDDEALAAALQDAAAAEDDTMANDDDESEEDLAQAMEPDEPLSDPARLHMEQRLAQMETEREKLDKEIAELRMTLNGIASTNAEQADGGADLAEPMAIAAP